jgi:hypothetical protein
LALALTAGFAGCCGVTFSFDLERNFNFVVMDNDPIDVRDDQFARLRAPDVGSYVGCEVISLQASAQLLDN